MSGAPTRVSTSPSLMPGARNFRSAGWPLMPAGWVRAPLLIFGGGDEAAGAVWRVVDPPGGVSGITDIVGGSRSKSRSSLPAGQGSSWYTGEPLLPSHL